MKLSHFKLNVDTCWQICLLFCLSVAILLVPDLSVASGTSSDGISDILCKITTKLTGPIGRGIATIAVVVLGIGLFLGKLSWALAIATALGIGLIFSAGTVVRWLSGQSGSACGTS